MHTKLGSALSGLAQVFLGYFFLLFNAHVIQPINSVQIYCFSVLPCAQQSTSKIDMISYTYLSMFIFQFIYGLIPFRTVFNM